MNNHQQHQLQHISIKYYVSIFIIQSRIIQVSKKGVLLSEVTVPGKRCFLSGISLALFQQLNFWSIKEVYFFENANVFLGC